MSMVSFEGDSFSDVLQKFTEYMNRKTETAENSVKMNTAFPTVSDISKIWWMDKHEMQNGNVSGCIFVYVPFIKKDTLQIYLEDDSNDTTSVHIEFENDTSILKACCHSTFTVDDKVSLKFAMASHLTENDIDAKFEQSNVLAVSFRQIKNRKPAKRVIKIG